MSSVAPIRQPRGPTSDTGSFGQPAPQNTSPPAADSDSLLRRNNTIGSGQAMGRHQPSASISASAAASGAFHGGKYRPKENNRFRSGSLTGNGGNDSGSLSRRQSGREVRREEAVPEVQETTGEGEGNGWSKGLSRQSSLPSRRGMNNSISRPPLPAAADPTPPPRPPRRISVASQEPKSPPTHSVSHSLSSLAAINRPQNYMDSAPPVPNLGASVSRTQSLRNQAKNAQVEAAVQNHLGRSASLRQSGSVDLGSQNQLGRASSLRQAGEHYRPLHTIASPSSNPASPPNPYASPDQPPASSTAALPPYHLPQSDTQTFDAAGADVKRHQSMGHYGRERRPPALLPLDARANQKGGLLGDPREEEPPTSPIGRSVWAPGQVTDDGWSRSMQGVEQALFSMNLQRDPSNDNRNGYGRDGYGNYTANIIHPTSTGGTTHTQHDEPSWVASLVGGRDNSPAPPQRVSSAGGNQWGDAMGRQQLFNNQRWPDGHGMVPVGYLQQQQQQQLLAGFGNMNLPGMNFKSGPGVPGGGMGFVTPPGTAGFMTPASSNFYSPPPSAPAFGAQDLEVIELARKKGLNPATFDCRPKNARFFVIKSYTEDDVQKSLKHEIWSSTVLGNKRLDNAFRESSERGPIFLFFSVNSSRHFCGVAQMLTPVDESQSSNVWQQDKWKGIFKVKWIFVRDVPSVALRHIRLINTPEQKPITNSRDTQEVHYEGGCEILQIFLDHQNKSKTSLLQDFAYYEKMSQSRQTNNSSPGPQQQQQSPGFQQGMMPQQPIPAGMGMNGQPGYTAMPGNGIPPVPPIPSRYRP